MPAYPLNQGGDGVTATIVGSLIIDPTFTIGGGKAAFHAPSAFMTTASYLPIQASTANTVLVTDTTYFQYLGRVNKTKNSVQVAYLLNTTLATAIIYGEMAIFAGAPSPITAPASLTLLGFTDCNVSGQFLHAPGLLMVTIALSTPAQPGDDLWLAVASKATTPAQFEALTINRIGTGITATVAGQPSVITSPCTTATINSTVAAIAAFVYI